MDSLYLHTLCLRLLLLVLKNLSRVLIYKMIVSSSSGNKIAMNSALEILMQKTDEHGSGLFESGEDEEHREKGTQSLQYSFQRGAW